MSDSKDSLFGGPSVMYRRRKRKKKLFQPFPTSIAEKPQPSDSPTSPISLSDPSADREEITTRDGEDSPSNSIDPTDPIVSWVDPMAYELEVEEVQSQESMGSMRRRKGATDRHRRNLESWSDPSGFDSSEIAIDRSTTDSVVENTCDPPAPPRSVPSTPKSKVVSKRTARKTRKKSAASAIIENQRSNSTPRLERAKKRQRTKRGSVDIMKEEEVVGRQDDDMEFTIDDDDIDDDDDDDDNDDDDDDDDDDDSIHSSSLPLPDLSWSGKWSARANEDEAFVPLEEQSSPRAYKRRSASSSQQDDVMDDDDVNRGRHVGSPSPLRKAKSLPVLRSPRTPLSSPILARRTTPGSPSPQMQRRRRWAHHHHQTSSSVERLITRSRDSLIAATEHELVTSGARDAALEQLHYCLEGLTGTTTTSAVRRASAFELMKMCKDSSIVAILRAHDLFPELFTALLGAQEGSPSSHSSKRTLDESSASSSSALMWDSALSLCASCAIFMIVRDPVNGPYITPACVLALLHFIAALLVHRHPNASPSAPSSTGKSRRRRRGGRRKGVIRRDEATDVCDEDESMSKGIGRWAAKVWSVLENEEALPWKTQLRRRHHQLHHQDKDKYEEEKKEGECDVEPLERPNASMVALYALTALASNSNTRVFATAIRELSGLELLEELMVDFADRADEMERNARRMLISLDECDAMILSRLLHSHSMGCRTLELFLGLVEHLTNTSDKSSNQVYLISQTTMVIPSLVRIVEVLYGTFALALCCSTNSSSSSSPIDGDDSSRVAARVGVLVGDALITGLRALVNLTNESDEGCDRVGHCDGATMAILQGLADVVCLGAHEGSDKKHVGRGGDVSSPSEKHHRPGGGLSSPNKAYARGRERSSPKGKRRSATSRGGGASSPPNAPPVRDNDLCVVAFDVHSLTLTLLINLCERSASHRNTLMAADVLIVPSASMRPMGFPAPARVGYPPGCRRVPAISFLTHSFACLCVSNGDGDDVYDEDGIPHSSSNGESNTCDATTSHSDSDGLVLSGYTALLLCFAAKDHPHRTKVAEALTHQRPGLTAQLRKVLKEFNDFHAELGTLGTSHVDAFAQAKATAELLFHLSGGKKA